MSKKKKVLDSQYELRLVLQREKLSKDLDFEMCIRFNFNTGVWTSSVETCDDPGHLVEITGASVMALLAACDILDTTLESVNHLDCP